MEPLRAVVFDLDGTLVRSMENHWKSYVEIFHTHLKGLREPTFLEVCQLEGKRAAEVIALLAERQGRPIDAARAVEMAAEKQRLFRHHGHVEKYPGAAELLAHLKAKGVKVGLATGTNRENTRHMLQEAIHAFEVVITHEDVVKTKPDPEPYLKAFAALGVPPARCAVVENAPLGIQSGRASGARVVAVTHTLKADALKDAHEVAPDLRAVQRILDGWSA